MTNGNSTLSGLPLWARVTTFVGIPGAIALYTVWIMSNTLPAIQLDIAILKQEIIRNRELSQEQVLRAADVYRLQQRICANTAKDVTERSACFNAQ